MHNSTFDVQMCLDVCTDHFLKVWLSLVEIWSTFPSSENRKSTYYGFFKEKNHEINEKTWKIHLTFSKIDKKIFCKPKYFRKCFSDVFREKKIFEKVNFSMKNLDFQVFMKNHEKIHDFHEKSKNPPNFFKNRWKNFL